MDILSPTLSAESYINSLLFGSLVNCLLYGALTIQLYLYYIAFPNDRKWTKAVVFTVYGLQTIQTIGLVTLLSFMINMALANSAAPSDSLNALTILQAKLIGTSAGFLPLISQCIYAHRIKIITGMKVVPCIIVTLAVAQLIAAFMCTLYRHIPIFVWIWINIVIDTIISVIMIRALKRGHLLSRDTSDKVKRLIYLIVGTGAITVAGNLAIFILCLATPNSGAFLTLMIFLPMLYANSILVMLNNRITIAGSGKFSKCQHTDVLTTLEIASMGEDRDIDTSLTLDGNSTIR